VVRGLNIQIANLAGVLQFSSFPRGRAKTWNSEILASWVAGAGGEDVSFSDFQFSGGHGENPELTRRTRRPVLVAGLLVRE
jgi:hypothetical protein